MPDARTPAGPVPGSAAFLVLAGCAAGGLVVALALRRPGAAAAPAG
ncbi:hypothetical protein [Streptomyces sp. NPDC093105]